MRKEIQELREEKFEIESMLRSLLDLMWFGFEQLGHKLDMF